MSTQHVCAHTHTHLNLSILLGLPLLLLQLGQVDVYYQGRGYHKLLKI